MKTLNKIIFINVLFILIMLVLITGILLININNVVIMYICFAATSIVLHKYTDWAVKIAIPKLK